MFSQRFSKIPECVPCLGTFIIPPGDWSEGHQFRKLVTWKLVGYSSSGLGSLLTWYAQISERIRAAFRRATEHLYIKAVLKILREGRKGMLDLGKSHLPGFFSQLTQSGRKPTAGGRTEEAPSVTQCCKVAEQRACRGLGSVQAFESNYLSRSNIHGAFAHSGVQTPRGANHNPASPSDLNLRSFRFWEGNELRASNLLLPCFKVNCFLSSL